MKVSNRHRHTSRLNLTNPGCASVASFLGLLAVSIFSTGGTGPRCLSRAEISTDAYSARGFTVFATGGGTSGDRIRTAIFRCRADLSYRDEVGTVPTVELVVQAVRSAAACTARIQCRGGDVTRPVSDRVRSMVSPCLARFRNMRGTGVYPVPGSAARGRGVESPSRFHTGAGPARCRTTGERTDNRPLFVYSFSTRSAPLLLM